MLYAIYRGLEAVLLTTPRRWRKGFFIFLGNIAYMLDRRHRRIVQRNMQFAFDNQIDAERIETTARYCFRNLMLNVLQVMENANLDPNTLFESVVFEGHDAVIDAVAAQRPIIFVSAHFGNWELGAAAISAKIKPTTSVHKMLNDPKFDTYLLRSRSRLHMTMVEKKGAVKYLARTLKHGGAISIMIDQNINPKDGVVVNFFGKAVTQTSTPAHLARKYDALIVPVFIHTQDERNYTVRFEPPVEVAKSNDADADILQTTQQLSTIVERIVRQEPKYWFWCHKRWKTKYPELYAKRS